MSAMQINFFIPLILCGVLHALIMRKTWWGKLIAGLILLIAFAAYIVYIIFNGMIVFISFLLFLFLFLFIYYFGFFFFKKKN